jgi:hypothetical protein
MRRLLHGRDPYSTKQMDSQNSISIRDDFSSQTSATHCSSHDRRGVVPCRDIARLSGIVPTRGTARLSAICRAACRAICRAVGSSWSGRRGVRAASSVVPDSLGVRESAHDGHGADPCRSTDDVAGSKEVAEVLARLSNPIRTLCSVRSCTWTASLHESMTLCIPAFNDCAC